MTTITLEVPDDLAERLTSEKERLPEILRRALAPWPTPVRPAPRPTAAPPTPTLALDEMIAFLTRQPRPEDLAGFRLSTRAQTRQSALLEKNREAELTETELAELDWYEYVHEIMTHFKALARPAEPEA